STTFSGYIGYSAHITIYKDISLTESFAISSNQQDKGFDIFNDFVIVGNKVVIAGKEKGLGVFEIQESYFKKRKDKYDIFNYRVKSGTINYRKYDNEEIIHLTRIPNDNRIVLTIKNNSGKVRHDIVEL
ncbi:MAG: hypothetical protein R6V49_09765, partial [Bacteroidales bacterium]